MSLSLLCGVYQTSNEVLVPLELYGVMPSDEWKESVFRESGGLSTL